MISLAQLTDRLANLPNSCQLLGAWLNWRKSGIVLLRKHIHPEDLRAAMAAVSILEIESLERISFRLHASNVVQRTGYDRKGENALDLVAPKDRAQRFERYRNVAETPCGMFGTQRLHLADGSVHEVFVLILPAATAPHAVPRFLYIAEDLTEHRDWREPSKIVTTPLAHDTAYIDIGRGVPV